MASNTSNNRERITIDTKVAIINADFAKREKSNTQVCRDFKIVPSTVYTILKEKLRILNATPFHQWNTLFFNAYCGNNDNPCYNDTF